MLEASKKYVQDACLFQSFYFYTIFTSFFVFQLSVLTDKRKGVAKHTADNSRQGEREGGGGAENWQKCADIIYGRPLLLMKLKTTMAHKSINSLESVDLCNVVSKR